MNTKIKKQIILLMVLSFGLLWGVPSGKKRIVKYVYNNLGQVKTIDIDNKVSIRNQYNNRSELIAVYSKSGNHSEVRDIYYGYNNAGQITNINHQQVNETVNRNYSSTRGWLTGISSVKFSETLGYNNNGNIKNITTLNRTISNSSYSYHYVYDGISRLKSASYGNNPGENRSESYQYKDDGGFRTKNRTGNNMTYNYHSGTHRLSNINGNKVYQYDGKGNVVTDPVAGVTINSYDHRNLALSVTKSGVTTGYEYNDGGNRIRKSSGSSSEYYLYGSGSSALAVYSNGVLQRVNIYGNGLAGSINYDSQGNYQDREYYLKDHLGSIRASISSTGNVVTARNFYPYGEELNSIVNRVGKYQFTEKERDRETGLDYFGARYYNSKTALWLAVDPLVDMYHGWSPYTYVRNNPLRLIDPTGMSDEDPNGDGVWSWFKTLLGIGGGSQDDNPASDSFAKINAASNIVETAKENAKDKALETIEATVKFTGEAADVVSDASTIVAVGGIVAVPFTGGSSLAITGYALTTGTIADATSTAAKTVDALAQVMLH